MIPQLIQYYQKLDYLRYHSLTLMKNVLKWFSKLIVTAPAADTGIHKKKVLELGVQTKLIISNEEMDDIKKNVKFL